MKVFWSRQNDYAPKSCRHFVKGCLEEAIAAIADDLGLEDADRPEIDHDTKGAPGIAEITATILDKISRCAVFVADLTPIGTSPGGKQLSSPDVLIELVQRHSELARRRQQELAPSA